MIRRHSRSAIFMHWFNAICWIFLLFSGFALLVGEMQPIGQWWIDLWHGAFGGRGLLVAHLVVGSVWVIVYALYVLLFSRREVIPFLREVTTFYIKSDLVWCMKKGMWLVLGPKMTRKLGVDPTLPPQGFYNAGQRMVAVVAVIASIGLAVTGVVMGFFSGNVEYAGKCAAVVHIHPFLLRGRHGHTSARTYLHGRSGSWRRTGAAFHVYGFCAGKAHRAS